MNHILHLLSLEEMPTATMKRIFAQARQMKRARQSGSPGSRLLAGRHIGLLFEKPSLRTRVSFEVAARELGAHTLYLSPREVGMGMREPIKDVARVLSTYLHAVVIRTFAHQHVEEFARYASIPVINALTDLHHPCQGLTDVFTIAEQRGTTAGQVLAYIGDGNNCAHSLLQAAAKAGMHVRIATPPGYEPVAEVVLAARSEAARAGGSVTLFHDPRDAASGAHVLYTDVWTSMGQEAEAAARRDAFADYQLDAALLSHAATDAIVLHPLPAHRGEEISESVLDGPQSRVIVQAENRLHVQKAILRLLLTAYAQATRSA